MMTKEDLISEISLAFKDVRLEEGIGLWEAQGIDDYADAATCAKLRDKDERESWENISNEDLKYCYSSLSFFDAKGMRFCLPRFMILDILETGTGEAPDVSFVLSYELEGDYSKSRFSLLNQAQIQCIIHFLEWKLSNIQFGYKELNRALRFWKQRMIS